MFPIETKVKLKRNRLLLREVLIVCLILDQEGGVLIIYRHIFTARKTEQPTTKKSDVHIIHAP